MVDFLMCLGVVVGLVLLEVVISRRSVPQGMYGVVSLCGRWMWVYLVGPAFPWWTLFGLFKLTLLPSSLDVECAVEAGTTVGGASVGFKGFTKFLMPTELARLQCFARFFGQDIAVAAKKIAKIIAIEIVNARMQVSCDNPSVYNARVLALLRVNTVLASAGFQPTDIVSFGVTSLQSSNTAALASRTVAPIEADTEEIWAIETLARIERRRLRDIARNTGRTVAQVKSFNASSQNAYDDFRRECLKLLADARALKHLPLTALSGDSSSKPTTGKGKKKSVGDMTVDELEKELEE